MHGNGQCINRVESVFSVNVGLASLGDLRDDYIDEALF